METAVRKQGASWEREGPQDKRARRHETDHQDNEGAKKDWGWGWGDGRFPKPGTSQITKLGTELLKGEGS